MSPEEWNTYIDTGFVPQYFIKEIVNGIRSGQRLNDKHFQVYITHGAIIEIYLKEPDSKEDDI
ncbi:hypothetical protein N8Z10_01165 [bacterium]|nr:hypothetical protein [bacterium]